MRAPAFRIPWLLATIIALMALLSPVGSAAPARANASTSHATKAPAKRSHAAKRHTSRGKARNHASTGAVRNRADAAKGATHRARTRAQGEFETLTGWPEGRPGYEIEYVKPLSEGGADDPGNMRWRKVGESKTTPPRRRG